MGNLLDVPELRQRMNGHSDGGDSIVIGDRV